MYNRLDEMVKLKEKYDELFWEGLTGLSADSIHITEELFHNSFDDYIVEERESSNYPYALVAEHNGTKFFCLQEEVDDDVKRNKS